MVEKRIEAEINIATNVIDRCDKALKDIMRKIEYYEKELANLRKMEREWEKRRREAEDMRRRYESQLRNLRA